MKKKFFHHTAWVVLLITGIPSFAFCEEAIFDDELSSFVKDFNTLKEELVTTRQAYQKLQENYNATLKDRDTTLIQLRQLQKEKAAAELQLKELQIKMLTLDSKGRELSGSLETKEKSLGEITQYYQQALTKSKEYEAKVTGLQNEKTALQAEVNKLKSQQASWEGQSKELTGSLQQLTGSIQDKEKLIAELRQSQAELLKKQQDAQGKIQDFE
ncbi:MAG TPA: hypothetical protein DEQ77_08345, partial [Candidatus Omnitrophica bacterium]|nr:hypothetical protein [Candidatus Omnitrophota bacterium]